MGAKRKVRFQGNEVWGEEVEFEAEREAFNTYLLEDGTKLKIKTVVSQVIRLEAYKADGEPVYMVNATNVIAAVVPERLKKKTE